MKRPVTTSDVRLVRTAAWVGLIVDLVLAATKLVAGTFGHSRAVIADAVHSLTDVMTDIAVLVGSRYWSAPADERHPHGHRRIETLVTVVIGLSLAGVAIGVGLDAVRGGGGLTGKAPGKIALAAAVGSIVVKEWLYRWTASVGRRADSPALVANAWHHRSDALSSIPAALGVGASLLRPEWWWADRVGAVLVCLFILYAAWRITSPAVSQLVDAGAPEDDRLHLESLARSVRGVRSAHALRTRYTGPKLAVDLHIEVDADLSVREGHAIGEAVRSQLLKKGPGVADVVVQVEPESDASDEPIPAHNEG